MQTVKSLGTAVAVFHRAAPPTSTEVRVGQGQELVLAEVVVENATMSGKRPSFAEDPVAPVDGRQFRPEQVGEISQRHCGASMWKMRPPRTAGWSLASGNDLDLARSVAFRRAVHVPIQPV